MSNFDPNAPSDNEWEDRGELAWNEFDWENYLRDQDEVIHRYIGFYEKLKGHPERIDEVAHRMGWDEDSWSSDGDFDSGTTEIADKSAEKEPPSDFDSEPYTLHKNPVFIATKAIYLGLKRAWERLAEDAARVPQSLALSFHASLYRGEEQAMLAIQALDFGDYAMAISLFKRALRELNQSFALIGAESQDESRALKHYREDTLPRLFDLREVWLRVMNECRAELERPAESDDEE
jgi:hypothetical protein